MFTELAPLLRSLDGQGFQQIRKIMKKNNLDNNVMINWWKLIPQRRRRAIKRRLSLFLFWREGKFGNWKRFMKRWRQRSLATRRKLLLRWRRRQGTNLNLFVEVIRNGTITKKTFGYLMRPLTKEQFQRIQLYLWAKLESCGRHTKVIKTGKVIRTGDSEPCLEIQISPGSPLMYF